MGAAKNLAQKAMGHPAAQGFVAGAKGAIKNPSDMMKFKGTRAIPGAMKGIKADAGLISGADATFRKAQAIGKAAPEVAGAGVAAVGAHKLLSNKDERK